MGNRRGRGGDPRPRKRGCTTGTAVRVEELMDRVCLDRVVAPRSRCSCHHRRTAHPGRTAFRSDLAWIHIGSHRRRRSSSRIDLDRARYNRWHHRTRRTCLRRSARGRGKCWDRTPEAAVALGHIGCPDKFGHLGSRSRSRIRRRYRRSRVRRDNWAGRGCIEFRCTCGWHRWQDRCRCIGQGCRRYSR
jgi:hypothetical protein